MSFFDGSTDPLLASTVPAMQRVLMLVDGVATAPTTVLLTGESGTGKEVIARAIHDRSPRHNRPFIAINCAAIPATLMESELFGHEKGAYSGASDRKIGVFERAQGGTLLLDEVGELPLELQAKLLRVIQERVVTRLGGVHGIALDVRLIAATNRDLGRLVPEGRFRPDLFYRLNVFPIALPPLRSRKADLPYLAQNLLVKLAKRMGRGPVALEAGAVERLMEHSFPGNVRELENLLERALVLSRTGLIREEALEFDVTNAPVAVEHRPESLWGVEADTRVGFAIARRTAEGHDHAPRFTAPRVNLQGYEGRTLADIEREVILTTLRTQDGNRTRTSDALGISIRTLRNRLREYRAEGYDVAPAPLGAAA